MKYKKLYCFIIFYIGIFMQISSQPLIPLEQSYSRNIDSWIVTNGIQVPTFVKPYARPYLNEFMNTDSLLSYSIKKPIGEISWLVRKWRYESFYTVDTTGFELNIDPLFDLQLSKQETPSKYYYTNTRGIIVHGNLNHELYFESSYYDDQATFPVYLSDYINSSGVVPGQSYMRHYHVSGFDYGQATGMLYYRLNKKIELSAGQDKLFAGDGYRSLFLSDNAYSFPFIRATYTNKYFQYTRIMAVLLADSVKNVDYIPRKQFLGGFNILTIIPTNFLQLSFFEGSVWNYPDKTQNIKPDYNYFNPIIFMNSFINNNSFNLGGIAYKLSIFNTAESYGQIGWGNFNSSARFSKSNLGIQFGGKYFNAFSINNLSFQVEYNYAAGSLYGSPMNTLNYSHYNQPLGHPFGNNFHELIFGSHYNYKCWFFDAQLSKYSYGKSNVSFPIKKSKYIKDYTYNTPFIGESAIDQSNLYRFVYFVYVECKK